MVKYLGTYQDIVGSGGGGGSSREAPTEAETTAASTSYLNALFLLGEGTAESYNDYQEYLQNIYLDETPIANRDGSLNFQGVNIEYRPGDSDQSYIPGFGEASNESKVGTDLTAQIGSLTRTIQDPDTDAVKLRILFPALQKQEEDGDIVGASVTLSVSVRDATGNYREKVRDTISEKFSSPYERSYRVNLHGEPPWDVKLTRHTPDSDDNNLSNRTIWQSYTQITDTKLTYPSSALLSVRISAKQFNNLPEVSFHNKWKKIAYPSNYNPENHTYSGMWDGTFKRGWSNNPAWIFFDLITNDRFGVGQFIKANQIDKWSLYSIGQYCDEKVPDGRGNYEPRFTFNGIIESREDAFKVLNTLASTFRGSIYWSQGTIFATQDAPGKPVKVFNEANAIQEVDENGQISKPPFDYSSSAKSARHSVALVSFQDPDNFYNSAVEYVEEPDSLERYGYNPIEITAFGCTSRAQARRLGRWKLSTERFETNTVTFKTGMEGAVVKPGEIIEIQDPTVSQVKWGGRVTEFGDDEVIIDRHLAINHENQDLIIKIATSDGFEERQITGLRTVTDEGYDFFDLDRPINDQIPNAAWIIESKNIKPVPYRVFSVTEDTPHVYEITGTQYIDDKYDYIDYEDPIELDNYTLQMPRVPSKPWDLRISLDPVFVNGAWKFSLRGSWEQPVQAGIQSPFTVSYEAQIKKGIHGSWQNLTETTSTTVIYDSLEKGRFFFRVRAVDVRDRRSQWVESVAGETQKPRPRDPLGEAQINVLEQGGLVISWTDVQTYRYSITDYRIEIDGELQEIVPREQLFSSPINRPPGLYDVVIKSIDFAGTASSGGIEITIGDENTVPNPTGEIRYRVNEQREIQFLWRTDEQEYPDNFAGYRVYINGTREETTQAQFSSYFDLPPDTYTIEVIPFNNNGYEANRPLSYELTEANFSIAPPIGEITKRVSTAGLSKILWTDEQEYNGLLGGYRVFIDEELVAQVPASQPKETSYLDIPSLDSVIEVFPYSKDGTLGKEGLRVTNREISTLLPNPVGEITKVLVSDGGVQLQWTDETEYPEVFEGYRIYVDGELDHATFAKISQSLFFKPIQSRNVLIKPFASDGGESRSGLEVTLDPEDYYPPEPNYLLLEQSTRGVKRLNWGSLTNPPDLRLYRVKFNTGVNYDWENAHQLEDVPVTASSWESDLLRGDVYTLLVKTVDITGLESTGFVYATVSLVDPVPDNIVSTIDFYDRKAPIGEGVKAEYYNNVDGNESSDTKVFERTEEFIDINWGSGSPTNSNGVSTNVDNFTSVFTGSFKPRYSGRYKFYISNDGDSILDINGDRVASVTDGGEGVTEEIEVKAGQHYSFYYRAYHYTQDSYVKLEWESERQVRQRIPEQHLYLPVEQAWQNPNRQDVISNLFVDERGYLVQSDPTQQSIYESDFFLEHAGDLKVNSAIEGNYALTYNQNSPFLLWTDDTDTLWKDDTAILWRTQDRFLPLTSGNFLETGNYTIRVTINPSNETGVIQHLRAISDLPDVIEKRQDVLIDAGGSRIAPDNEFEFIKAVNVTLQDTGTGARYAQVVNKNPNLGSLIECYNESGQRVEALIDLIYIGY